MCIDDSGLIKTHNDIPFVRELVMSAIASLVYPGSSMEPEAGGGNSCGKRLGPDKVDFQILTSDKGTRTN